MTTRSVPTRRGLSLLELMLALSITALVAAATASMTSAVTAGVGTRRDNRSTMIRANAAQTRLSAYIAPCRSLLDATGSDLVLWREDSRESDTVHATEIRWLMFDPGAGTIDVLFVEFPAGWTEVTKALFDNEYASDEKWSTVLLYYQTQGWIKQITLVDGLSSAIVSTDKATALGSRQVRYELEFDAGATTVPILVSATVRSHQPPL